MYGFDVQFLVDNFEVEERILKYSSFTLVTYAEKLKNGVHICALYLSGGLTYYTYNAHSNESNIQCVHSSWVLTPPLTGNKG